MTDITQQLPQSDTDFSLADPAGSETENASKNTKLEKLYSTVNTLLGGNSVEVEMFDDDYKTAFEQALLVYRNLSSNSVYKTFGFLSCVANVQTYPLNDAVDNVTAIYRKRSLFGSAGTGFDYFSQVSASLIYPGSQPGGYLGVATYDFALQYEETLNRLFAREMQFIFRPEAHSIYLMQNPKGPEFIVLECYVLKTIEECLSHHWSNKWLTDYTHALSMEILGTKRSKFATLPGAQGGTQLNGERLLERAEKMKERLEDAITKFEDGSTPAYAIMG